MTRETPLSTPVVSVLMLAYNHANYIKDAIDGVLRQRVAFPIELVIAEDCSSDATREIVMDYQRRHPDLIQVIISGSNVGMHENHLRALRACKGEYVAYCEGDDYWHHPDKLAMQVAAMRADPAIGLVHTEFDYRVESLVGCRMMQAESREVPSGDAFEALLHGYNLATATLMYRKRALDQFESAGLDESGYRFADYNRALFTSLHWKLAFLPVSTATYRYMPGSAMNSGPASTLRLRQSSVQCRKDFMTMTGRVPDDLAVIERDEQRLLYGNAYLARDKAVFEAVADWLRQHDPAWSGGLRHQVRRVLMRVPPLHRLVQKRAHRQWWRIVKHRLVPMTIEQQVNAAMREADDA